MKMLSPNNQTNRLNLYRYTWQPLVTLVVSFLILISFISLFQNISKEKQLRANLISQVSNRMSSFSSELYLNEPDAIRMGLQIIIDNLNTNYPDSLICIKLIPNKKFSGMSPIKVCNQTKSDLIPQTSKVIAITVGNVQMGKVIYYAHIRFNFANLFPSSLLISILIALLIALICNFFLIKRLKISVIVPLMHKIRKDAKELATAEIMKQVAHDIRSPLVALELLSKNLTGLSEKQRLIVKNVTQRISQIANELLATHKAHTNKRKINYIENCLAYTLISNLISEKQVQLQKMLVNLSVCFDSNCYDTFIRLNYMEFKRVLSNIIDNAAEASAANSEVSVKVRQTDNKSLDIAIIDHGKGVSPDILKKIFDKGVTNKEQGSGLGLFHAKNVIEQYGGTIKAVSTPGKGAAFHIVLPTTESPTWFAHSIDLNPEIRAVAILDDSNSIHQVWDTRFKTHNEQQNIGKKTSIQHFMDNDKFIIWYQKQKHPVFVLMDYELADNKKSGLDIIEQLRITKNVILVTSHFEDETVIKKCQKMAIKVIPKEFALHIPIEHS